MKYLLSALFSLLFLAATGNNATFEKLAEVNKCWLEQPDIHAADLPAYRQQSEHEWIRTHLQLVESTLRRRSTAGLTVTQLRNRRACLDHLHTYWQAGAFPINEDYTFRTPIFIDRHNNFCAVGYLIKASGHEDISRMIAARTNLAYVREMHYPELAQWAHDYGFTTDELAWIQPGYPPTATCGVMGGGVAGEVRDMLVDGSSGRLYLAGSFATANDDLAANNICYLTPSGGSYLWSKLGTGVNGTVNAMAMLDGKLFAGGSFTSAGGAAASNIAYWDGSVWHEAGCVDGVVNALAVFDGKLYAAGEFTSCTTTSPVNLAWWDGALWQPLPGISGHINTLATSPGALVIGGSFSYGTSATNILQWTSAASFAPYTNSIANEVMDINTAGDSTYVACKRTSVTDSNNLLLVLRGSSWQPVAFGVAGFYPYNWHGTVSFNTICPDGTNINLGGAFGFSPGIGTYASNCYNVGDDGNWVIVDSTVNKMVIWNGDLVMGGSFVQGLGSGGYVTLNGLAVRKNGESGVQPVSNTGGFALYPNPAKAGSNLHIQYSGADTYQLHDCTGRQVAAGSMPPGGHIAVPQVAPGVYLLTVAAGGKKTLRRVTID